MKKIFSSQFQLPLVFAVLIVAFFGGTNFQTTLGIDHAEGYLCDGSWMTEDDLLTYRDISLETMQMVSAGRGLTFAELCGIPQAKLDRAVYRSLTPKPDHPGEAVEFRRKQLEDENGEIPADGYTNAQSRMNEMLASQDISAASAGIETGSWSWIGPGNIGGRVRALAIHPINTDIMWVGSVSGGIWKSFNAGESWQAQDDFMANLAVTSIVIDPNDPDILYAGTGEGFHNGDALQGAGVFKTTDGGATWSHLGSTSDPEWWFVNRLAISPDGNTLLAATWVGIYQSTTGGASWNYVAGDRTLDINFDPSDSTKAIASGSAGNLWYSTNSGSSWTLATYTGIEEPEFSRVEVAYAPSSSNIIYASIDTENSQAEIWRSTDGGVNFALRSTSNEYLGSQGWYDNVIWVDPTNANNLIVGGIDLWDSSDGGVTLHKISQWWDAPNSAHADHHIILADPDFDGVTNKKVYFGNDGGVYRADNVYTVAGSSGWTELNNNLGITQFYGAAGNPTTGDIIGGTQDNGTLFYGYGSGAYEKNTEGWIETYGGDGGFSAADSGDSNYFYGEYVGLQIHRSDDGGNSAEYIDGKYWYWNAAGGYWEQRWKNAPYRIDDAMNGTANFIAPFILDPNNQNRLLAGGAYLWRTNDVKTAVTDSVGPSWTNITLSISTGYYISAIAVKPGDSNTIWIGYENGDIYKTTDGGTWWYKVDDQVSLPLPDRYVSRIAIDSSGVVYATFTGFHADNIYKTTSSGSSWVDSSGALPALPIRSIVINPQNSNYLYLGTELGVFTSEDAGVSWDIAHDGPANVSVDELFFLDDTTLVAATHGRGLFTATLNAAPPINDNFDTPVIIPSELGDSLSTPYRTPTSGYLDTASATTAGDDPAIADCDIAPGTASVWYEYTPNEDAPLAIDTKGSGYDTYLAVWTGSRGNLTPVVCNDDINSTTVESQVAVNFLSGTTYSIEAGQYNGDLSSASVGGDLVLNIDDEVSTVTGKVYNIGGYPIVGAIVSATGQSAVTNGSGEYILYPVPDGTVTIKAEASGYMDTTEVISVPVAGGMDLYLRPLPENLADFDGDGKTDPSVFEKATGNWFVVGSQSGFFVHALNFGNDTNYIPVPGDYDGDGKTDVAVFEKATGNWFVVGSQAGYFVPALNFGNDTNYIPVPGDYDGDGKTDPAVFEKTTGNWFIVGSQSGFFVPALNFGNDTNYIPVPRDYDGDGKIDVAVFEKATGNWFVVGSQSGYYVPALNFGNDTNYITVPDDYDGDGKADVAVFEKATGNWFVVGSQSGFFVPALNFGNDTNYIPVPGDYDGDGKTDTAVFEKASGNWFVVGSQAGYFIPALSFGNDTNYLTVIR